MPAALHNFAVQGHLGAGLAYDEGLHAGYLSTYITLIRAVLAGRGIGLGWRQLVAPMLASGDLVQIGARASKSADAYYLISDMRVNTVGKA